MGIRHINERDAWVTNADGDIIGIQLHGRSEMVDLRNPVNADVNELTGMVEFINPNTGEQLSPSGAGWSGEICPKLKAGVENAEYNYSVLQACANLAQKVMLPKGEFYVSQAITPAPGQTWQGYGFNATSSEVYTLLRNNNVGGGIIEFRNPNALGAGVSVAMPKLFDIGFKADYPVLFNDPTTAITHNSTSTSNVPFPMRAYVNRCYFEARTPGVGTGFSAAKMFDSEISHNWFVNFDTSVHILGCDLNTIEHNRFMNGYRFYVLELRNNTFGSQNIIRHNDMVAMAGTNTSKCFIKSVSRHTRIYDNYLEHLFGGTQAIDSFIDTTIHDLDRVELRTDAERFSSVIENNRIDSPQNAVTAVYKLCMERMLHNEVIDNNNSGTLIDQERWIKFFDKDGNRIRSLPVMFNELHQISYRFFGVNFGDWDGFSTETTLNKKVTNRNLSMFRGSTLTNSGTLREVYNFLRYTDRSFKLKAAVSSAFRMLYPQMSNVVMPDAKTTVLRARARTIPAEGAIDPSFLGSEIIVAGNLSGFTNANGASSHTDTTFTSSGVGGVLIAGLTVGVAYSVTVSGSTTAGSDFSIRTADAIPATATTVMSTSLGTISFVADRPNLYLRHGATGTTTIAAISVKPILDETETVSVGFSKDLTTIGSAKSFTVGRAWSWIEMTLYNSSWSNLTGRLGAFFTKSTNHGNDIEFSEVSFETPYDFEVLSTGVESSITIDTPTATGKVTVAAYSTASKLYPAHYVYEFVDGALVLVASSVADVGQVSASAAYDSGTGKVTVTVSGSAATKIISAKHRV